METVEKNAVSEQAAANVLAGLNPAKQATATRTKAAEVESTDEPIDDDPEATPQAEAEKSAKTPPVEKGFVSKEDAKQMIADAIANDRKERENQTETVNIRERFIREKMNDLPMSVQNLMPKTGDLSKLAHAEKALRSEMGEWLNAAIKKGGYMQKNVGGEPGGYTMSEGLNVRGAQTGSSPTDLVMQGLRNARPG